MTDALPEQSHEPSSIVLGTAGAFSQKHRLSLSLLVIFIGGIGFLLGFEMSRIRASAVTFVPMFIGGGVAVLGVVNLLASKRPVHFVLRSDSIDLVGRRTREFVAFSDVCVLLICRTAIIPKVEQSTATPEDDYIVMLRRPLAEFTKRQLSIVRHTPTWPQADCKAIPVKSMSLPPAELVRLITDRIIASRGAPPVFAIVDPQTPEPRIVNAGELLGQTSSSHADAGTVCLKCGYDIRNIPVESRCPECAWPIRHSILGCSLKLAERAWLSRVELGAAMAVFASGVITIALIAGFLSLLRRAGITVIPTSATASLLVLTGAVALLMAASFFITEQDLSYFSDKKIERVRKLSRYGWVAIPIVVLLAWLIGVPRPVLLLAAICSVGWSAGLLLQHAGSILARIPLPKVAKKAVSAGALMQFMAWISVFVPTVSLMTKGGPPAAGPLSAASAPSTLPAQTAAIRQRPIDRSPALKLIVTVAFPILIGSMALGYLYYFVRLYTGIRQIRAGLNAYSY